MIFLFLEFAERKSKPGRRVKTVSVKQHLSDPAAAVMRRLRPYPCGKSGSAAERSRIWRI